ncbi:MAG: hypothetical protein DHS20C20_17330 [Ardenticatenaceae bacterium]|nr:MAG: hypothetical protein DHS20C20_17330 [Ardenticatenaceae bacterium]
MNNPKELVPLIQIFIENGRFQPTVQPFPTPLRITDYSHILV